MLAHASLQDTSPGAPQSVHSSGHSAPPSSGKDHSSARDPFWYHSLDSEPPRNHTPGLIPLLKKALLDSVEKGATRHAVLCYEKAVHIHRKIWDAGWGCGNFMMLCAALMDQPIQAAYSSLLSSQAPPSVNGLKVLVEEAWKCGFDPVGAKGLKGKLVGHRKWIGTAELYVAFTYIGIPCQLTDISTPKGKVGPLLDWIRHYFDADSRDHQTSLQEGSQGATLVVVTERMPFVLQYQGHSRTIVGYEITRDGTTILLTFDPSRRMKTKLRGMALSCYDNLSTKRDVRPDESKCITTPHIAQSLQEPFRSHRKRHPATPRGNLHMDSSASRPRTRPRSDDNVVDLESEEAGSKAEPQQRHDGQQRTRVDKGRMRTGKSKKVISSKRILKQFRIAEKTLARRDKYQVLWFPMEDPLTESDKLARREVISELVC